MYIDGTPIRVFRNNEAHGVPFPTRQPVHVFASIWNAEEWATQGGRVKTNWSEAPFAAAYRRFDASNACEWHGDEVATRCGGDFSQPSTSRRASVGLSRPWLLYCQAMFSATMHQS